MFTLKKIIGSLLMPLPLAALALVVAWILIVITQGRRGRALLTTGMLILFTFSQPHIAYQLAQPLQSQHAPIDVHRLAAASASIVVVLSAGGSPYGHSTVERIGGATLHRLHEGARICKALATCTMIVTGNARTEPSTPHAMRQFLIDIGIPADNIIIEGLSRDTHDHAIHLAETLKGKQFYLVTSATHLPRSLALFKHEGLDPTPAPTYFTHPPGLGWGEFIPSEDALKMSNQALHEYLGMAWSRLRGQL